jgi:cell division protease FtsH
MVLRNSDASPEPKEDDRTPQGKRPAWVTGGLYGLLSIGSIVSMLVLYVGYSRVISAGEKPTTAVPISRLAVFVRDGQVQRIVVEGDALQADLGDGSRLQTRKEAPQSVPETLRQYGVPEPRITELQVEVRRPPDLGALSSLLWFVPLLVVFWLLARGSSGLRGGDKGPLDGFLHIRARQSSPDRPVVRFDEVAGVDEAKQELTEIVDFLRRPERYAALGARIPKGVLIVGPPGTGKTLLARAVAGEAGVPFFSINASEFVELFVGVGASRVRDLFRQAHEQAPAIIFIDEIDAIGRHRGTGLTQSHEEREQTLNQILAELDGFDPRTNVVVMAATNRPDVLDAALLRPGRFDRRVTVENPDREGRLAILGIHARGKPLHADIDLAEVARATVGFSGADLENLLNEAALLAARRDQVAIGREDLEEAGDRVMAGPRRRGHALGPRERDLVAYHEAGHALVAHRLPHADPAQRVSIVARGAAGGHTRLLPEEDRRFWTRSQLEDALAVTLGGLTAEELVFGEPTTGPGSDLERASALARHMVLDYGMSERLGPVVLNHTADAEPVPLVETRAYSEETASLVDAEVQRLVREAHDRARQVLTAELDTLDTLVARLLEQETLHREDLDPLLGPPAGPGSVLTRRTRAFVGQRAS